MELRARRRLIGGVLLAAAAGLAGCDNLYGKLTVVNRSGSDVIVAVAGHVWHDGRPEGLSDPMYQVEASDRSVFVGNVDGSSDTSGHVVILVTVLATDCHEIGRVSLPLGNHFLAIDASGTLSADTAPAPTASAPAVVTRACEVYPSTSPGGTDGNR